MTPQESRAINSLRFVCIVFLVIMHTRVQHLAASSLGHSIGAMQTLVNIPLLQILFVLSGYLFFFCQKESPQGVGWFKAIGGGKIKKRVRTLLVPYIIWCLIAIVYNHYVKHAQWPSGITDFLLQFWDANGGHPIGKAMWYMKSLMVFTVLSPLYYYAVRFLKHSTPIAALVLFLFDIPIDCPYLNVWLLIGSYLGIMRLSFGNIVDKLNWKICLVAYLLLKALQFACVLPSGASVPMVLLCFAGLFGLLMKFSVPPLLAASSSFIYFAHPYFTGVRNIYMKFVDASSLFQFMLVWMLTALTVFAICYALYRFMKRFMPKVLNLVTGDRG